MAYTTQPIKSVEGFFLPNAGERAIYWQGADYTDVFTADDFRPSDIEREIQSGHAEIILPC